MRRMSLLGAETGEAPDPRLLPYAEELAAAGIKRTRVVHAIPLADGRADLLVEGRKEDRPARCLIEAGEPLSATVWYFPDRLGQWPWEVNEQRFAYALGPLPRSTGTAVWVGARPPRA